MTGTDLFGPDGSADGRDDEEELRILLHEAVPALQAPDDRMERVLARVDRTRRRRRAAGLAAGLTVGLAAAVLAAAPALAPSPGRGAELRPAGSAPAQALPVPPAPQAPSGGPSVSPAPGTPAPVETMGATGSTGSTEATSWAKVRFPLFPAVVVSVPPGWHTRAAASVDPTDRFGYLSTQPLQPVPSCTPESARCSLSGPLFVGGAVLTFRLVDDQGLTDKLAGSPSKLMDMPVDKTCAMLGGSRETIGLRTVDGDGPRVLVEMTACLRQPADSAQRQAQQVFDSVRSTPVGTPSPGPDKG